MKGYLIRVGMDTGRSTGGVLAPIFENGRFEYIPIRDEEVGMDHPLTYKNIPARIFFCQINIYTIPLGCLHNLYNIEIYFSYPSNLHYLWK